MIHCGALDSQKELRDLAQLPRLADQLDWIQQEEVAFYKGTVILSGVFLKNQIDLTNIIFSRSKQGLNTLLVPRFYHVDLQALLHLPLPMKLVKHRFETVLLQGGRLIQVPGQLVIDTPFHAGRWGVVPEKGNSVLAFRSNDSSGFIVFCTAFVCSRPPGIKKDQQRLMLELILNFLPTTSSVTPEERLIQIPATPSEYMSQSGAFAAQMLLSMFAAGAGADHHRITEAALRMNLELSESVIASELEKLPTWTLQQMEAALRNAGWGAHLRRARSLQESL